MIFIPLYKSIKDEIVEMRQERERGDLLKKIRLGDIRKSLKTFSKSQWNRKWKSTVLYQDASSGVISEGNGIADEFFIKENIRYWTVTYECLGPQIGHPEI